MVLLEILCVPETVMAAELQKTKNIHIAFELIDGEVLLQFNGAGTTGKDINLYHKIQGFRTTSIRSMNRNGEQYTELEFQTDNPDDPMLLVNIFTHVFARDCMLRYDSNNDTLNLIINNAEGIRINSHNGQDLLSPVNTDVPGLMLVWPGNTEIFEVDASIN